MTDTTDPAVPADDGDPLDHLPSGATAVLRVLRAHPGQWVTEWQIEEEGERFRYRQEAEVECLRDALIVLRSRGLIECREEELREWRSLVPPDDRVILRTNDGAVLTAVRCHDGGVAVSIYGPGLWPEWPGEGNVESWEFATLPSHAVVRLAAFLTTEAER